MRVFAVLIVAGAALAGSAVGQDPPVPPPVLPDSAVDAEAVVDPEAGIEPQAVVEPEAVTIDTLPPVTALGALGRSMILPGWGQLAVGRPTRGAIYFATEGVFLYMVFKSSQKLNVAKRAENQGLIESRTRQRENWIVLAGFVAFMSGVDAWVSTHFWDYEPSITAPPDGSIGVSLGFKVNLP